MSMQAQCAFCSRCPHDTARDLEWTGMEWLCLDQTACRTRAAPRIEIFVFGSNTAGRHGKGAALAALREHGAIYGQGVGLQGRSYAIPTKGQLGRNLYTLHLSTIRRNVEEFLDFARANPEMTFRLTPIGCGLAGYKPEQIAPMFVGAPPNVIMPPEFAL
jgi:hypothetical protein